MRHLAITVEQQPSGDVDGWFKVTPITLGPDGLPSMACVAMLVDALGGVRSITAADPDWAFTADLTLHLVPCPPMSELMAKLRVRRRGRRTLVIEAELLGDRKNSYGFGTLTFAVVDRPAQVKDVEITIQPGIRSLSSLPADEPPSRNYIEELPFTIEAPGVLVCDLQPEIANTAGALHGAVHTAAFDEAGKSLARALWGVDGFTTDCHLAFLDLALQSPLRVVSEIMGEPSEQKLVTRAELRDADGKLCSYATTTVMRA